MSTEDAQAKYPGEDEAVIRLYNDLPWADVLNAVADFELAFRRLLEATADQRFDVTVDARLPLEEQLFAPLDTWDAGGWFDRYEDGLEMTAEEVDALSVEGRRALVAHLVHVLDCAYSGPLAELVRGLADIVYFGQAFKEDEDATRPGGP
jgi:hypothetical protein